MVVNMYLGIPVQQSVHNVQPDANNWTWSTDFKNVCKQVKEHRMHLV